MPGTFSVPDRWPASWPPPQISGRSRPGSRAISAPTPFGPCTLWAESAIVSAPEAAKEIGIDAAAWTASTCSGTPRDAAIAASSATGWTTPVTLLAHIAQATRSSSRTSSANAAGSITPFASTGAHPTSKPWRASSSAGARTAGCSITLHTSLPSGRPQSPNTAWLSASVPPEV